MIVLYMFVSSTKPSSIKLYLQMAQENSTISYARFRAP